MWWMLMLQQEVKNLKNKCSKIESQGKQKMLKFHKVVNSQNKLIIVEEIFLNISKWMLNKLYFKLGIIVLNSFWIKEMLVVEAKSKKT
jgi:hypothetical protein